jgi:hypothetical protein
VIRPDPVECGRRHFPFLDEKAIVTTEDARYMREAGIAETPRRIVQPDDRREHPARKARNTTAPTTSDQCDCDLQVSSSK